MEKISSDDILNYMKTLVESKKPIPREDWLNVAFRLEILRLDEAKLFNEIHQAVALKKQEIVDKQEKVNMAAAEGKIETLPEYIALKNQEAKLYTVDEMVRIAKKSAEMNF